MKKPRICDNCGRQIGPDEIAYWVRLEIFASPEPPEIKNADLKEVDFAEQVKALIEQMERLGPEECEAQVYEAYRFVICTECRAYFHNHLKDRPMDIPGQQR